MTPQEAEAKARETLHRFHNLLPHSWDHRHNGCPTEAFCEDVETTFAAALLAAANDKWNYGHHKPGTIDYFHDYGDCGGNLQTGCGFSQEKLIEYMDNKTIRGGNKQVYCRHLVPSMCADCFDYEIAAAALETVERELQDETVRSRKRIEDLCNENARLSRELEEAKETERRLREELHQMREKSTDF